MINGGGSGCRSSGTVITLAPRIKVFTRPSFSFWQVYTPHIFHFNFHFYPFFQFPRFKKNIKSYAIIILQRNINPCIIFTIKLIIWKLILGRRHVHISRAGVKVYFQPRFWQGRHLNFAPVENYLFPDLKHNILHLVFLLHILRTIPWNQL